MEYELEIYHNKSTKNVKVIPSVYIRNKAVFQVIINKKGVVLFKDDTGNWRAATDGLVDDDMVKEIGKAIDGKLPL